MSDDRAAAKSRKHEARTNVVFRVFVFWWLCMSAPLLLSQNNGPIIVVETTKGTFEIETYSDDAPKTVAHIVALVKQGFYDGQRIHRAIPGFLVQWGDPRSRDTGQQADWGRGPAASSGTPVGVAEISSKRLHAA